MKRFFRTIIMCLISVVSVSLNASAGCNWLCDCPDEPAFSNSFSTSGCSSNDNWCWQTYTSGAFNNDRLNPTATFGVDCCGWHSGGEGSGSVQLAINEIAAPISVNTSWWQTGCGSGYDALLVLVNQANVDHSSDYTNNPINVNINNYGQVQLQDTPLRRACANAAGEEESEFYNYLCNLSDLPTASTPCVVSDTRLVCSLPIACAIFQYTNNGGGIWNDCYFILFPPSPPPFCCTISMPSPPPTTANICQEKTSPSSNNICVMASPDAGRGVAPVVNNFFTPSIRVAFNSPSSEFLSVTPWYSNGSGSSNFTPPAGTTPTVTQCTSTGQQNCIIVPHQSSTQTIPTNMEVIYYLPSTTPLVSRYYYQTINGSPGSLYGVNLGSYCDLNHNLLTGTSSSCTITDSNGSSREFMTYLKCASSTDPRTCSSVCVQDVNFGGDAGPCSPVPAMPWPVSVAECNGPGSNTPTNFCMNLTFQDGYSGQIQAGTIPSNPPSSMSGMVYYPGSISGPSPKIPLQAMVTDDNYSQPDMTGNICLNSKGAAVSTPCPAYKSGYQPGGLYYVNGQYMGGGTQLCYLPYSSPVSCPSGCVSDCNCVESKLITNPAAKQPCQAGQQAPCMITSSLISDRVSPAGPPAFPLDRSSLTTIFPSAGNGVRGMNALEAGLCVPIPLPPPSPPLKPISPS